MWLRAKQRIDVTKKGHRLNFEIKNVGKWGHTGTNNSVIATSQSQTYHIAIIPDSHQLGTLAAFRTLIKTIFRTYY